MIMRYFPTLILSLFYLQTAFSQVISISDARLMAPGAVVTVRGIVTNGDELGKIRYMQDGTAGIAAFPGTGSEPGFETSVFRGDSIEVTGTLIIFQGLLEISPISAYSIITQNNPDPAPQSISLAQITDAYEGQVIAVECVNFGNAGGTFSGSGTYGITDSDGGQSVIFVRSQHPLNGTGIPVGAIHLTAIVSKYGDFQLLPRDAGDFVSAPCFYLSQTPDQTNITTTGFNINWKTNLTGSSFLQYGSTPSLGQTAMTAGASTNHEVSLGGLQAGNIYWVRAISVHNLDTVKSDILPFATRSTSSGEIQVYFNHSINEAFLGAKAPLGVTSEACLNAIIDKINNAQQTIEVAVYNNNRSDIINALVAAHNRGVQVRYVAALAASSPALDPPPAFPVVYGNDIALMHNKFMVIDADMTDKAWVMSGSLNWTNGNIFQDYNNLLFIQDQSLARGYRLEFDEMWGSSGAVTDPLNQKFGSMKKDNTPHRFIIGGIPVESWFSPSDKVTDKIVRTIESANASAEFELLTFTKNEPADALIAKHANDNVSVRGLIENTNDNGSEFLFLLGNGIDVGKHYQQYELHHKYLVVDALLGNSDPTVLTGSHNWSQSAESQNDENTLIFHDGDIARLYRSEFEQRAAENPVGVKEIPVSQFALLPNPATSSFVIKSDQFDLDVTARVQIWTQTGQLMSDQPLQYNVPIAIGQLADGFYIVKIKAKNAFAALPLQKISR